MAYFAGVQVEECSKSHERHGLGPKMRLFSVAVLVKIAVRGANFRGKNGWLMHASS